MNSESIHPICAYPTSFGTQDNVRYIPLEIIQKKKCDWDPGTIFLIPLSEMDTFSNYKLSAFLREKFPMWKL